MQITVLNITAKALTELGAALSVAKQPFDIHVSQLGVALPCFFKQVSLVLIHIV